VSPTKIAAKPQRFGGLKISPYFINASLACANCASGTMQGATRSFARYWGFTPRLCRPYRAHHPDLEQELRGVGIDLRRFDHRQRDSGPVAASLDDHQLLGAAPVRLCGGPSAGSFPPNDKKGGGKSRLAPWRSRLKIFIRWIANWCFQSIS
jgi:hypothetical protein